MTLREIVAEWQGTDQELLDHLNDPSIEVKNEVLQTNRAILQAIGPEAYELVSATLKAAAASSNLLDDFRTTLITTGVNFADPITQLMITQLSGAWPAGLTAQLRALGITYRSLADELLGRAAQQPDIGIARRELYEASLRQQATNAAALFQSRMEQAPGEWDAAEQAIQWAAAWEDQ